MCKVFTHATRIRILNLLRDRERSVGELADALDLPQPNVSQHLTIMRSAGILLQRREGTTVHYRLADARVIRAFDIIREVLRDSLGAKSTTVREAAV
jgi:ArsR family transcriptional regulator